MPTPRPGSCRVATTLGVVVAVVGARVGLDLAGPAWARVGLVLDALAALAVVAVAFVVAHRRRDGRSRRAWLTLAAFPLAWVLAPVAWLTGLPGWVADVGRTLAVLLIASSWWYASRAGGPLSRVRFAVDGAIGSVALLALGWGVLLSDAWQHAGGGLHGTTAVALPLMTVGVVVMGLGVTVTEMRPVHRDRPALFLAAMLVLASADLAWATGRPTFWAAGWVGYALAMHSQTGTTPRVVVAPHRGVALYLPYLLVGPAVVVLVIRFRAGTMTTTEIVAGLAIVVLLLVRQHVTLAENAELVLRLEDSQRRLRYQATHDALTGLPGRAALQERLAEAAAGQRLAPARVALAFVDVDAFKHVNDWFGHAAGDAVLVEVARRLVAAGEGLGDGTYAARLGGDEFAVLALGPAAADPAALAAALSAAGDGVVDAAGAAIPVRLSVGVAGVDRTEFTPSELLHEADLAMYEVKRARGGAHAGTAPEPGGWSDLAGDPAGEAAGDPAAGTPAGSGETR